MESPKLPDCIRNLLYFTLVGREGPGEEEGMGWTRGPFFRRPKLLWGGPPFFQRPQNVEGVTGPSLADQDDLPYIIPLKIHVFGEEGVYYSDPFLTPLLTRPFF